MPAYEQHPAGEGLALARAYFVHEVAPLLERRCPSVPYAAARIGAGSEVLGLDDVTSRDHDWGLRLQVFVADQQVPTVLAALDEHLPQSYRGHPVRFPFTGQQTTRLGVDVSSPTAYSRDHLGFCPTEGVTTADWLSLSGQAALEVVAGEVFVDQVGELGRIRKVLTWFPDDIWRYVVACDWQRLDQEIPLMGRAGDRGDELGARVIAARLVGIAIHLAFTLSRVWQPYSKWRGTMFSKLDIARRISSDLELAVVASDWSDRCEALGRSLVQLSELQSEVGLPTRTPVVVPFWDRPYLQINPSMVGAVLDSIVDPSVRDLPLGLGSIDQRTDNVDILLSPAHRRTASGTLPE